MRHINKYILTVLFLTSELWNLTLLPSFTDETNYLDWGWRMTHLPGHIFYSLYDAKQPLIMWLFGWAQNFFSDPLYAGRFISVLLGLGTLWGVYAVAKKVFSEQVGFVSAILYATSHYFFFFNRQSLIESGLAMIFIWSLWVLVALEKWNLIKAVVLGVLFGLGYLSKSNALLVVFATTLILLRKHKEEIVENFGRSMLWCGVMFATAIVINLPMLMHPWFNQYIHLSTQYTWSVGELLKFPGKEWLENLSATLSILLWFITPATIILSAIGIFKSKKYSLAIWIFLPLAMQVIMAKFLVSRYLVAYLPAVVIFAAYLLVHMRNKYRKILVWALVLIPNLYFIFLQLTSPPKYFEQLARVTHYSYQGGYVTEEASGYNLIEARAYFDELVVKEGPFALGIAVYSGNPEAGLLIYYRSHPHIKITYLDAMLFGDKLKDVDCLKFNMPVYLATRDPNAAGLLPYFNRQAVISNSYGDAKMHVFKLKTDCEGKTLDLSPGS